MDSKDTGSLVAQRTLKVLLLFNEHKNLTLSEIARALDISQAATHRLVSTLNEMGFLRRDESKRYTLGSVLIKLARQVEPNLRNIAHPIMQELSQEVGESVYLSVSHNSIYFVFIDSVESPHPLKWVAELGKPNFAMAGSVGKAHLAFIDGKVLEQHLSEYRQTPYTSNTIVDKDALIDELNKIRHQGYSFSQSERYEDVFGFSVPILDDRQSKALAFLSVFVPSYRYQDEKLSFYVSSLKSAANKISTMMDSV